MQTKFRSGNRTPAFPGYVYVRTDRANKIGGGLLFFMGLQGYLEYAPMETADPVPYTGDGRDEGQMGTPLDYGIMIAYFAAMLGIGTWFGRKQKGTKDFFFGGQRFAWWLIAFSLVATTIGSYSFVKYSKIAYGYGIASSQTYLNDWFWMPLALFGFRWGLMPSNTKTSSASAPFLWHAYASACRNAYGF